MSPRIMGWLMRFWTKESRGVNLFEVPVIVDVAWVPISGVTNE